MSEENLTLPELIGWLLHKHDLSEEDLAALLNISPITVERWLDGEDLDLACASTLLGLIQQSPDRILPLLGWRADHSDGDGASWPSKIAEARAATGLAKTDFAGFIGAAPDAVSRWQQGVKEPASCYAVLIDLLYAHPREMIPLLESVQEEPPPPRRPWTRKRLMTMLVHQRLSPKDLALLLGVLHTSLLAWLSGDAEPSACSAFFLSLLERFPQKARKLLSSPIDGEWTSERLRDARGSLTAEDLGNLTGIHHGTIHNWENGQFPIKTHCPTLLYAALERYPRMLLEMADQLV